MRALVVGAGGQDGSYLMEQLAAEGVEAFGLYRRPVPGGLLGDLLDQDSLERALRTARPGEVYNVAAVTSPGASWGSPVPPLMLEATGLGVVRLMNAMLKEAPNAVLVHASSSAVYDLPRYGLYGAAKLLAHEAVAGYRDRLHCSNAVLYSHTSPRQDKRFLAPRIFDTLARIAKGSGERLTLGDVDSRRDWGYAPDYCAAMRRIARAGRGDFVVATSERHTVRELVEVALKVAGLAWDDAVTVDPTLPKVPDEPESEKPPALRALGWKPRPFVDMVRICMEGALNG